MEKAKWIEVKEEKKRKTSCNFQHIKEYKTKAKRDFFFILNNECLFKSGFVLNHTVSSSSLTRLFLSHFFSSSLFLNVLLCFRSSFALRSTFFIFSFLHNTLFLLQRVKFWFARNGIKECVMCMVLMCAFCSWLCIHSHRYALSVFACMRESELGKKIEEKERDGDEKIHLCARRMDKIIYPKQAVNTHVPHSHDHRFPH